MKQLSALWWMVRIQIILVAIIYYLYSIYHVCMYIYIDIIYHLQLQYLGATN